jgi:pimeloyl-ACP methyl ester carboxylesterase
MKDPESERLVLRDGRRIAWAEYGDRCGRPVFYFHGQPGSRKVGRLADETAHRLGVRLLVPDRPGFGRSDFQEGRSIADWPDDVGELADALGLGAFIVAGLSGGGPYALACAWKIPHRLDGAGVVAGVAPMDIPGITRGMAAGNRLAFFLARRFGFLHDRLLRRFAVAVRRDPAAFVEKISRRLAEPDRSLLEDWELRKTLGEALEEAFRYGVRGPAWEARLLVRPWGFPLEGIRVPVRLWQGEQDTLVPSGMGRYLAEVIPDCRATFLPEEGHISVAINRREEILSGLLDG